MISNMDAPECTRSAVYLEILGPELYAQTNARTRGHIFWFVHRHKDEITEVQLLERIAAGTITIEKIEEDHQQRDKFKE